MRRFLDANGAAWDIVLGRESWGMLYALFVPLGRGRTEPVRQTLLTASSYDAAERELDQMSDQQLAELFARSEVKS